MAREETASRMHKSTADISQMPKGLAALIGRAEIAGKSPPPVDKWHPPYCGDLDIHIAGNGAWSYMGSPIGREALVRLFASVLRKDEDGRHYLVTPVERIGITVDDAPFLAVELHAEGDTDTRLITLRTNVGDVVVVDSEHPLRFEVDPINHGLKPYVLVRGRLEALLARPLLYELAELFEEAETEDGRQSGIWSGGCFFALPQDFLSHE